MLLFPALLLPLVGGALLPLFHFKTLKNRALYTESIVVATSILIFMFLLNRPYEAIELYRMTDTLTLAFRADGMSCIFAGLIAVLWPITTLYGFEYCNHEERPNTFFSFYTMTYAVTLCVAFSANLFTLYVFYECLTLITVPLVIHKQDNVSIHAGRTYLYYSITGAALAFIGLIVTLWYGMAPNFTMGGILDPAKIAGHEDLLRFVFLLAFMGFGTKAAVFPMHAWLPAASVAPTPVTALLHAVAVVNAGAYAVLRMIYYVFGTELLYGTWVQTVVLAVALFTVVFGSAMAVKEQHFKKRLAWSTISNLSYMLMGAALMTQDGMVGSLSHLLFHGLMKITLFSCAGAVLIQTGGEYVQDLRGYGKIMPLTCGVFAIASIALVGIPPLCGFVSKWNLLVAAAGTGLPMGQLAVWALIISAILTAIYLFSIVGVMYFRPLNAASAKLAGTNKDAGWMINLPLCLLAIMLLAMGLFSQPLVTFLRGVSSGAIF